jgi:death-on-curing protein
VNYLDPEDVVTLGRLVLPGAMEVRDWGLVESALARPQSTVFGEDAYPSLYDKAAALLLSLVINDPLVGGNRRMELAATVAFLLKNGQELVYDEDTAYDFVISVADGTRREVTEVADVLAAWARPLAH